MLIQAMFIFISILALDMILAHYIIQVVFSSSFIVSYAVLFQDSL